jgi:hypothetical protein
MDTLAYIAQRVDAPDTPDDQQLQDQASMKALSKATLALGSWYAQWDARLENWASLAGHSYRPDIARIMKLSVELETTEGQMPYARDLLTGALASTGDDAHNPGALVKSCTGACPGDEALRIVDQLLLMDKALLAEYKQQDAECRKAEEGTLEGTWISEGHRELLLGKITFDRCYLAQLIARLYGDTQLTEVSHTMQSFLIALDWRTGELGKFKTEKAASELYNRLKKIVHHSYLSSDKELDPYREYTKGPSPTKVDVLAYTGPKRIAKAVDLAYHTLVSYWCAPRAAFGTRDHRGSGASRPSRTGSRAR